MREAGSFGRTRTSQMPTPAARRANCLLTGTVLAAAISRAVAVLQSPNK
jgi:hypothetical protein